MDNQALVPDLTPLDALEEVQATQEAQQPAFDDTTASIANLGTDDGWKNLSNQMQSYIDQFRSGDAIPINTGDSFEVIGMKYMVCRQVADKLQEFMDKVTTAQKAIIEARQNDAGTGAA